MKTATKNSRNHLGIALSAAALLGGASVLYAAERHRPTPLEPAQEKEARASTDSSTTLSDQTDLNLTVYRQQQHIERLERELRAMRDQVEAMSAAGEPAAPRDDVPPHY